MNSIKLSAAALTLTGSAFADISSMSATVENVIAGYDTYRIFINFESPEDKLLAVNGDVAGGFRALSYEGGLLYNSLAFGALPDDFGAYSHLNPGDSYLTIGDQRIATGTETQASPGFLAGNADSFGQVVSGDSFTWENNGGYFDSNPTTGVFGTGPVVVAQLTVPAGSDVTFGGTASFNSGATGALTSQSFEYTTVPAPGALALLGLAGLGRRRRG